MRYSGALFDVDGVLVDTPHERAWREALQQLMEGPWCALTPQTSYAPERFTTAVYQEYVAGKPRAAGAQAALSYFGIPDPDGQRLQAYMETKQARLVTLIEQGDFVAFDDALRLVLRLAGADVRLGVASSSKNANLFLRRVSIGAMLAQGRLGKPTGFARIDPSSTLLDLFAANTCGRDFAHGKPAPDIFLATAAELGLAPDRCVVIEDAVSGVQAARAGGMACVGVARLHDEQLLAAAHANWVVASLDELPLDQLGIRAV